MPLTDGASFGPYTIMGKLGRGGMASVYRAFEARLDREVALKVLPEELVESSNFADRFEREARVVAKLEHPSIVPLYSYGIDEDRPWMALRLVRGGHLGDRLEAAEPLSYAEGLVLFEQLAKALDHAHANGIIHRDLKPQNVLLDGAGHAYLADFGIARLLEASTALTGTGVAIGTPQYMAPEQAEGKQVSAATDTYSLAVMCYRWLAGCEPFSADTPLAVMLKHLQAPVPLEPLSGHGEAVARVLVKAMAKAPEDRYTSASAFTAALRAALEPPVVATSTADALAANTQASPQSESGPTTAAEPVAARPTAGAWVASAVALLVALLSGLFGLGMLAQPEIGRAMLAVGSIYFAAAIIHATVGVLTNRPNGVGWGWRVWLSSMAMWLGYVVIEEPSDGGGAIVVFGSIAGVGLGAVYLARRLAGLRLSPIAPLGLRGWLVYPLLAICPLLLALAFCEGANTQLDPILGSLWSAILFVIVGRSRRQPRSGAMLWFGMSLALPAFMLITWISGGAFEIGHLVDLALVIAVVAGLLKAFDTRLPA